MGEVPGIGFQRITDRCLPSYKDFAITIDKDRVGVDRDSLKAELRRRGIETEAYYSPALHQMTYFREHCRHCSLVNTEVISGNVLSLPVYFELSDDDIDHVVASIYDVVRLYSDGFNTRMSPYIETKETDNQRLQADCPSASLQANR